MFSRDLDVTIGLLQKYNYSIGLYRHADGQVLYQFEVQSPRGPIPTNVTVPRRIVQRLYAIGLINHDAKLSSYSYERAQKPTAFRLQFERDQAIRLLKALHDMQLTKQHDFELFSQLQNEVRIFLQDIEELDKEAPVKHHYSLSQAAA